MDGWMRRNRCRYSYGAATVTVGVTVTVAVWIGVRVSARLKSAYLFSISVWDEARANGWMRRNRYR